MGFWAFLRRRFGPFKIKTTGQARKCLRNGLSWDQQNLQPLPQTATAAKLEPPFLMAMEIFGRKLCHIC
ncbi:hypothetical protein Csa_002765 [Cucumis sativus]|nr:hypothetical protein Csa_002765 [Cucumis sativus]